VAEGIFPKSDGEVLFASEVNNLRQFTGSAFIGTFTSVGSSNVFTSTGSLVLSGMISGCITGIFYDAFMSAGLSNVTAHSILSVSGVNTGTKYISSFFSRISNAGSVFSERVAITQPGTEPQDVLLTIGATTIDEAMHQSSVAIPTSDDTVVVHAMLRARSGGGSTGSAQMSGAGIFVTGFKNSTTF